MRKLQFSKTLDSTNTKLAPQPGECLECIIMQARIHLIEPTATARFQRLVKNRYKMEIAASRQETGTGTVPNALKEG